MRFGSISRPKDQRDQRDQRDHQHPPDPRPEPCPPRQPVSRFDGHPQKTRWTWPPALPFSDVLEGAQAGEDWEIGVLYHRYLPVVYRYILARVADVPTAEDLTSETFMAMMRGIRATRAEDELGFAAWLLGIARNQILMHFRKRKVHPEVALEPQWWGESQSVAEEDDPLLVLMAREAWSETVAALNQLTREQREVVLLRCVLGYPTDDVARLMHRQTGTIRALQFRALASLTRLLNASREGEKPHRRRNHVSG